MHKVINCVTVSYVVSKCDLDPDISIKYIAKLLTYLQLLNSRNV